MLALSSFSPEQLLTTSHLIIYGHNMRVKSMFGSLHDFESERFL